MKIKNDKPVLVTGATGYVAGRLIPLLLASGYRVRTMGRTIEKMADRSWSQDPNVELVKGDIMDVASLRQAVKGCGTVYYLVHSMISQKGKYRDADRIGAKNMVEAAAGAKADHLIYLGGLGDIHHKNISRHLVSRNEVGQILLDGPVPATVLRAAMILGSGSASFEILRYLAERLPVMVTPKWVSMPTQPIAITNVLGYLKGCMEHPETRGKTFDIGGPEVVTYSDLFRIFAKVAGFPAPVMIKVPVLTPRLSSLWIHLVTPVPAAIAQPLTEGLSLPTTCTETGIRSIVTQELITCREAIRRALDPTQLEHMDTCRTGEGEIRYPEWAQFGDAAYSGGTILQCGYKATVDGTAPDIWASVVKVGGETGNYATDLLWEIRGALDILFGGIGLARGRRSKSPLKAGDCLDFWRVLAVENTSGLLLMSEMKIPGEERLRITIRPKGTGRYELLLLTRFLPRGFIGILYWYVLYPFHQYAFSRMLREIVRSAGLTMGSLPVRFTPKIS